jgi:hypothetical protein
MQEREMNVHIISRSCKGKISSCAFDTVMHLALEREWERERESNLQKMKSVINELFLTPNKQNTSTK